MKLRARVRREFERRALLLAAEGLRRFPAITAGVPRRAWLFGGAVGRSYIDNSAALHRHVVGHRPGRAIYWVIDRDSPDVAKAQSVGPVMYRDALSTWVSALSAEVHVISHGAHDVPASWSRLSKEALKVRLGHGLTALKKTKPRPFHTNESANAIFDLVPVASEFERENKRAWHIPDHALVVTGLPRFDELYRKARLPRAAGPRRIVYMPTWRDWVPVQPEAGRRDPFFRTILDFLSAPALADVLRRHDAVLDVCLHPILRSHLLTLRRESLGERIGIVDADVDVQDVLAASDALVTDYSSVTWDALYVNKPVLFFVFDLERYEAERGAYFDMRRDLPGPSAATVADCVEMIDEEFKNGLVLVAAAQRWQTRAFAFRDDNNAARVLACIEERLVARRWSRCLERHRASTQFSSDKNRGFAVRVLQLMKTMLRGGAEVLAASLVAVHRPNIEIVFGYFQAGHDTLVPEVEKLGATAICIPCRSHLEIIASADRVARLLSRERIDLVHCHLPLVGVVGRLAARYVGKPLIYTEHNLFSSYHPATRLAALATWPFQDHVIAVSEEVKRALPNVRRPPPVTLVRNAVNLERFRCDGAARSSVRARLGIRDDALVVGTVAVFRPAKRLDRWLEVARAVAAQEPRATFILIGFGPLEQEVRAWGAASGLGQRLVLPGPQDDVRPFLSAMDVYLMTSDFEGLPIALLEAMACELPIVSTPVGGIPEVLVDGETGALVPARVDALATRVVSLLRSSSRADIGRRARARVQQHHGLAAMARTIEAIYDEALTS